MHMLIKMQTSSIYMFGVILFILKCHTNIYIYIMDHASSNSIYVNISVSIYILEIKLREFTKLLHYFKYFWFIGLST